MKDQIIAAARKRGKSKDIVLDGEVKVTVRELTPRERRELDDILFDKNPDGTNILLDDAGNPSPTGEYYKVKEGKVIRHEWLRATMTPAEAVDVIMSEDVPESVRDEIFTAAREVNGFTLKDAVKN